jgi:uncharacterized OB-fold protein
LVVSNRQTETSAQPYVFSGKGTIYSFTVLQEVPAEFEEQAPLFLSIIQLDEGPLVIGQLTDVDGEVSIGDPVEMVTRKLLTEDDRGMIVYGYKFRPILQRS